MSDQKERWVTVRVEDTGDGLIIHPEDAKEHGIEHDQMYQGYVLADGRLRIPLVAERAKP